MLFEAHNDLPAMYRYIAKIYPSISSLVLVKDTDLTINKTGYHPEIEGIISKDGEKIVFAEVMRVCLGVVSDLFLCEIKLYILLWLWGKIEGYSQDGNLIAEINVSEMILFWVLKILFCDNCNHLLEKSRFDIKLLKTQSTLSK